MHRVSLEGSGVKVHFGGSTLEEIADGRIDPEQAWFWTRGWQTKEREADDDLAAGRATTVKSDDELLWALEGDMKPRDADS